MAPNIELIAKIQAIIEHSGGSPSSKAIRQGIVERLRAALPATPEENKGFLREIIKKMSSLTLSPGSTTSDEIFEHFLNVSSELVELVTKYWVITHNPLDNSELRTGVGKRTLESSELRKVSSDPTRNSEKDHKVSKKPKDDTACYVCGRHSHKAATCMLREHPDANLESVGFLQSSKGKQWSQKGWNYHVCIIA